MRRAIRGFLTILAVGWASSAASAAPITVLDNHSEIVIAWHVSDVEGYLDFDETFGAFGASIGGPGSPTGECIGVADTEHAEGSLMATIGTHEITGSVFSYHEGCHSGAYSILLLELHIQEDVLVHLEAFPTGRGVSYGGVYVAPGETAVTTVPPGGHASFEMMSAPFDSDLGWNEVTGGRLW